MLILLCATFGLIVWSMRLMFVAFRQQDFSFLFAGTLVAMSAAGIVVVYALMSGCMGYLSKSSHVDEINLASSFSASPESIEISQPADSSLIEPSLSGQTFWIEEVPDRE